MSLINFSVIYYILFTELFGFILTVVVRLHFENLSFLKYEIFSNLIKGQTTPPPTHPTPPHPPCHKPTGHRNIPASHPVRNDPMTLLYSLCPHEGSVLQIVLEYLERKLF